METRVIKRGMSFERWMIRTRILTTDLADHNYANATSIVHTLVNREIGMDTLRQQKKKIRTCSLISSYFSVLRSDISLFFGPLLFTFQYLVPCYTVDFSSLTFTSPYQPPIL